jgi:hypothetical protein
MAGGALAGCAGPIGDELVDWDHGARHGRVLELLDAQAGSAAVQACIGAAAALPAGQVYAKVRYRKTRMHHNVVALVPAGLNVQVRDGVELWPDDCAHGEPAHISRVLPSQPGKAQAPS